MIILNMLNFEAHLDLWRESHIMNSDMISAKFESQFLKKWCVLHYLAGITKSQPGFSKNKWCQTISILSFTRVVDQRKDRHKAFLIFIKVTESFFKLGKRNGLIISTATFLGNWLIRCIPVFHLTDKCWRGENFC